MLNQDEVIQIQERKFDYALLNKLLSEVKKSFWKMQQKRLKFDKQRQKYDNKMICLSQPGRDDERAVISELLA